MLDMTMMLATHRALRRDLDRLARVATTAGDDPARLHAAHSGWQLFSRFLTVHHIAEDEHLWPRMRELVAGRADDLELLDAMEAEHGRIDPLVDAIETTIGDVHRTSGQLGDLVDALAIELRQHLEHEERDALPLLDRELGEEEWARFGESQRARIGERAAVYLPWLLDEAEPARVEAVLRYIPPHLAEIYHNAWRKQYLDSEPWGDDRKTA